MKNLSKAEEMILLSILRLDDNAYGVAIKKDLLDQTGKEYTYGTLYGLLEQLFRKGYVEREEGTPTAQRGGRRKSFYSVTSEGADALKTAMALHQKMWQGVNETTLEKLI